ncbi:MAG: nucleotidyltransferase domain-containing protein [Deltaproteobacteria bacterium]|nr:nucleotidyltransferase domain-containing protein [Deltaproteobacteria bacterium]MBW1960054.1 nucleotidyltransferase domain-containing protein [Deltaproteobacteria bacterium]MBW1996053.1 nucleotidyltransferase domain-containing protein [Deltaproteobacteria bacterium]MBW2152103.1 nucleotidyltransferase domain-containing protein [Deltaproteobacteria bacterium]
MPSKYTTFAVSRFLNPEPVINELKAAVRNLKSRHPDIQAVYLFGSYASGIPGPKSDADLIIVTQESSIEDLQAAFLQVSVPVDLYILKPATFQKKAATEKGIAAIAVRSGIKLL